MNLDVLIFGGGVAGLWLLDAAVRAGHHAVLCEANALGAGQTVASQGIIHGGIKYTFHAGRANSAAQAVSDMPNLWRQCYAGERVPDLTAARTRADHCHLWRTGSLLSRAGMFGATHGLATKPEKIDKADWPSALKHCPDVRRIAEQVIDTVSLVSALAAPHRDRIIKANDVTFDGNAARIGDASLQAATIIFTAGAGNADLRRRAGLSDSVMQRRPLHMVMLRGELPTLNGHCADGARTRVTVTTASDSENRTVWQVGGQVSEDGVAMEPAELIAHTKKELLAAIPGLNLDHAEWATYRVDRAEHLTDTGRKPDSFSVLQDGPFITAWPTKLVLAPLLADAIVLNLPKPAASVNLDALAAFERPVTALPPWETAAWTSAD